MTVKNYFSQPDLKSRISKVRSFQLRVLKLR